MRAHEVDLTRLREQRRERGVATATAGRAVLSPPAVTRRPAATAAPPAPVPVPRTPFVLLILLVVTGGVLGILVLHTKVNENAFLLHDLRQEQAALDQRQQELEQEIARADTPANLAAAARELGLVQATELAYLRLPDGEVVREPVPAAGPPVSERGESDSADGTAAGADQGSGDGTADGADQSGAGGSADGTEG